MKRWMFRRRFRRRIPAKGDILLPEGIPSRFGRVFVRWRGGLTAPDMDKVLLARGFSKEKVEAIKRIDPEGYHAQVDLALVEEFKEHRKEIESEFRKLQKQHARTSSELKEKEKIELEALRQRRETLLKEEEDIEKAYQDVVEKKARERVRQDVIDEMVSGGYLRRVGNEIVITPVLIERYASMILQEETKGIDGGITARITAHGLARGIYEKGVMRSRAELDRLDIVNTWVRTRLHYPGGKALLDEDVAIVARELYTSTSHVVILLDKSGSMGENKRLENAKRAVMALYKAVKLNDPKSTVDILTFDNDVRIMDLYGIWECQPGSFTNTGEALRRAYEILRFSKADRRIVYLITDGLPESYTDPSGRVIAGDLHQSMRYAEEGARRLQRLRGIRFVTILLEAYDPKYVSGAERISSLLNGSIYTVEGKHLAKEVLRDFLLRSKVGMET